MAFVWWAFEFWGHCSFKILVMLYGCACEDMLYQRWEHRPKSHHHGWIPGIEIVFVEQNVLKHQQLIKFLLYCDICVVGDVVWQSMGGWHGCMRWRTTIIFCSCSDICDCYPFFMMTVDMFYEDILVKNHNIKNKPLSCHFLKMSQGLALVEVTLVLSYRMD